jgi:hypothetical protein
MDELGTLQLIGPIERVQDPHPQDLSDDDFTITDEELAALTLTDEELATLAISDEELTALALAADPMAPLGEDALPMNVYLATRLAPLPNWYMPAAASRARKWRWPVVSVIVFAFVLTAALGLCATYGALVFA